jgi:hypothetical protein
LLLVFLRRTNDVSAVAVNPFILVAEHLIYPATVVKIGSKMREIPGNLLLSVLMGMKVSPLL